MNIFFRIIKSRESIILNDIKSILNFNLGLSILFCILQGFIIINISYSLYKKYKNLTSETKIMIIINKIINFIYWEPLNYLHDILAPHIPGSGKLFIFIAEFIEKGNVKKRYILYHNSYIFFSFFPQLLISIVFFFEIIIYKKIEIFFLFLPFILVPLIFQIYLRLCISYGERNIPGFFDILNIVGSDMDCNNNYRTWKYSFKPEYSLNSNELLKEKVYYYELIIKIKLHAEIIKRNKSYYDPYISLISSSLLFLGTIIRLSYLL